MEQMGYLQEKKAKRKKRRAVKLVVLLLLLEAAAGIFYYQKRQQAEEENPNAEDAVALEKDQRWLYLQIEEITGNEIQAVEIKDGVSEAAGGTEKDGTSEAAGGSERGSAQEAGGISQTYMIPVGTDVVTKLGSVTTFSRLAAGDVIHCLTQQEGGETVILKIWIEE